MKSPLRYQFTEYDSGITSILNGISYVLDREKINPAIIASVYRYSLDQNFQTDMADSKMIMSSNTYNSKAIMSFIAKYLDSFDKTVGYKLHFKELENDMVSFDFIKDCTANGGVIVMPIKVQDNIRYMTITNVSDDKVFLFDPYYMPYDNELFKSNRDILVDTSNPFTYNRVINKDRLLNKDAVYSMSIAEDCKPFLIATTLLKEKVKFAKRFDYIFRD